MASCLQLADHRRQVLDNCCTQLLRPRIPAKRYPEQFPQNIFDQIVLYTSHTITLTIRCSKSYIYLYSSIMSWVCLWATNLEIIIIYRYIYMKLINPQRRSTSQSRVPHTPASINFWFQPGIGTAPFAIYLYTERHVKSIDR